MMSLKKVISWGSFFFFILYTMLKRSSLFAWVASATLVSATDKVVVEEKVPIVGKFVASVAVTFCVC